MTAIKLTEEQGQTLLQNYCRTTEVKFIKYELLPISEVAEGYLGEHYNLRVTYLKNSRSATVVFFLKHSPTINKYQIELAQKSNVYAREIFLYDDLFKQFRSFGFDTSFSAECFYCIPDKAMIMQNMTNEGFVTNKRDKRFNITQMKCTLKALALYHAAGYAYEAIRSQQTGKKYRLIDDYDEFLCEAFFIDYLPEAKNTAALEFWSGGKLTLMTLVDLLPLSAEEKSKFKEYLAKHRLGKAFAGQGKYAKTVGHGDLWSNNILFKMDGNEATACCLVDYQVARYFYPSFDVILAIYSNTDRQFRDEHLRELLDYYYSTLTDIYRNYGFCLDEIMTRNEFEESFELVKIDALYQVASVSAITCIPKEILNEKGKSEEDYKEAFFNNHKISAEVFETNQDYRKVLTEVMIELYEASGRVYNCD